ncbi:unnamed protein product, partial [Rotaria sp. Silwood2]
MFELIEVQAYCVLPSFFGVPVGTIVSFGGQVLPSRWLWCNGSAISRTTYSDLYAAIGDSFGAGDGSDTFNLPNLVDKFPLGQSSMLGSSFSIGGTNTITLMTNQLPKHTHGSGSITVSSAGVHSHTIKDPGHNHGGWTGTVPGGASSSGTLATR